MSRKKRAPKKIPVIDPVYKSAIIPKLVNSIMYDGKKTIAEKIVYDAIDKIKSKAKEEPINVFNEAINNIKPTVEVRSRRVGGATYQVPVEVGPRRAQSLSLRWLVAASDTRPERTAVERVAGEILDASGSRGGAVKKREDIERMAEANRAYSHYRW